MVHWSRSDLYINGINTYFKHCIQYLTLYFLTLKYHNTPFSLTEFIKCNSAPDINTRLLVLNSLLILYWKKIIKQIFGVLFSENWVAWSELIRIRMHLSQLVVKCLANLGWYLDLEGNYAKNEEYYMSILRKETKHGFRNVFYLVLAEYESK